MLEKGRTRISMITAMAVVVASMVGTGVFTSLGFQVRDIPAGFPILVLWGIGGLVSLCGALCYAELVVMMPRSGGEYHLLSQAVHPLAGFLAGWVSIMAGFAAPVAAAGVVFGTYLESISAAWDGVNDGGSIWNLGTKGYGLILVCGIAVLQLLSLQWVERFQNWLTCIKIGLIGVFVVGSLWMGMNRWDLLIPGFVENEGGYYWTSSYAVALVYVMYAYTGWNGAVYMAGEMSDVRKDLPRALVWGTLAVMLIYVILNGVFLISAPWKEMEGKTEVALVVARWIFGEWGGNGMGAVIAFGLVAHVSAMLFAGTRVLGVLGQDVWFLRFLGIRNQAGAPWLAVLLLTAGVVLLMLTGTFEQLLIYIQGLLLLSSMLCVAAVPWLRWKRPDLLRPFKTPGYPVTPIVYLAVTSWMLWALVKEKPLETALGMGTLAVGIVLYVVKKFGDEKSLGS